MAGPFDCMACGLCCTSQSPAHVRVTGEDWSRLGEEAEARTTWTKNRAYMRMEDGRCASLEARPGGVACAIYERRPEVCRTLVPGSPACAAEIARKAGARLPVWRPP